MHKKLVEKIPYSDIKFLYLHPNKESSNIVLSRIVREYIYNFKKDFVSTDIDPLVQRTKIKNGEKLIDRLRIANQYKNITKEKNIPEANGKWKIIKLNYNLTKRIVEQCQAKIIEFIVKNNY